MRLVVLQVRERLYTLFTLKVRENCKNTLFITKRVKTNIRSKYHEAKLAPAEESNLSLIA
jgi:hypothetical protein